MTRFPFVSDERSICNGAVPNEICSVSLSLSLFYGRNGLILESCNGNVMLLSFIILLFSI